MATAFPSEIESTLVTISLVDSSGQTSCLSGVPVASLNESIQQDPGKMCASIADLSCHNYSLPQNYDKMVHHAEPTQQADYGTQYTEVVFSSEVAVESEVKHYSGTDVENLQNGVQYLVYEDVGIPEKPAEKTEEMPAEKPPEKVFTCSICQESFSHQCVLKRHMSRHADSRPFACPVCNKTFKRSDNFIRHKRTHTVHDFPCTLCNKTFTQSIYLVRHMKLHPKDKPFICTVLNCGKSFAKPEQLDAHYNRHIHAKRHLCNICMKTFSTSYNLRQHMKLHTNEKKYSCHICNKSFTVLKYVWRHLKTHTDYTPYEAGEDTVLEESKTPVESFCEPRASTECPDKPKSEIENESEENRSFVCIVCNKSFTRSWALNKHSQTHKEKQAFSCTSCSKSYTVRYSLARHMDIPPGHGLASCAICNRVFSKSNHFIAHMAQHADNNVSTCPVCKKTFTCVFQLNAHMQIHSGSSKRGHYKCPVCPKSFAQQSNFYRHKKTHNRVNPFMCVECAKTFVDERRFTKHLGTHKSGHMFACTICDQAFTKPVKIVQHLKRHSSEETLSCVIREKYPAKSGDDGEQVESSVVVQPFLCAVCEGGFSTLKELTNHVDEEHLMKVDDIDDETLASDTEDDSLGNDSDGDEKPKSETIILIEKTEETEEGGTSTVSMVVTEEFFESVEDGTQLN